MLVKDWLSVIKSDRAIRVITVKFAMSGIKSNIERDFGDFELESVEQDETTGRLILHVSQFTKCDCYRTRIVKHYLSEYEKGYYAALHGGARVDFIDEEESYCIGTKERECCTCGGDKRKCDFYPAK